MVVLFITFVFSCTSCVRAEDMHVEFDNLNLIKSEWIH